MELILGLDMATHVSGVAIIDMTGKLIDHFNICDEGGEIYDRCVSIYNQLDEYIKKYPNIKYVGLEDTLLNKFVPNLNSCRDLITLKGWIQSLLYKYKLTPDMWTPNEWKGLVDIFSGPEGRTRAAQKERAIKLVKAKYGIDVDDNQADAICIAIAEYILNTDDHKILEV